MCKKCYLKCCILSKYNGLESSLTHMVRPNSLRWDLCNTESDLELLHMYLVYWTLLW